jgi:hypothetical protein
MSLSDPNPSPEREPHRAGASPKRPQLLVSELDPIAVQIPLENFDRLMDILHLGGVSPNSKASEYLWKMLLNEKVASIHDFQGHLGALGLSLELDIVTKHEIECRSNIHPLLGGMEDRVSVTLSTRHRKGNEIGALTNWSEGAAALEGLYIELIATPLADSPGLAHISWDEDSLTEGCAAERWNLLRGFYQYFTNTDLPNTVSLLSGQHATFHYLSVDLDPMTVRVRRLKEYAQDGHSSHGSDQHQLNSHHEVEFALYRPPAKVLAEMLRLTGALHVQSPWATPSSRREVVDHLLEGLHSLNKLDMDVLKMCADAHPCVIFSREEISEGDCFPPTLTSKITMIDYTCRGGEFRLELTANRDDSGFKARCRWHNGHSRFAEVPWDNVRELASPYLIEAHDE